MDIMQLWNSLSPEVRVAIAVALVIGLVQAVLTAISIFLPEIRYLPRMPFKLAWRFLVFILVTVKLVRKKPPGVLPKPSAWLWGSFEGLREHFSLHPKGISIPYQPRGSSNYWDLTWLLSSEIKRIIFLGETGVGKTTEALELIRRLSDASVDPVIFWLPSPHAFGPPTEEDIRSFPSLRQHRVLVLIDDVAEIIKPDSLSAKGKLRRAIDAKALDFRERLIETLDWFTARCDDFWIVLTIRNEADVKRALSLDQSDKDHLWRQFHQPVTVKTVQPAFAKQFLRVFTDSLGNIELDSQAEELLVSRFDGTFVSLVSYLYVKAKQLPTGHKVTLTQADVADFSGFYPDDWERTEYKRKIRPHAPSRAVYEALATLSDAGVVPYWSLIVDVASHLLGGFVPLRRWRIRRALRNLFGPPPPSKIVFVHQAYLRNKSVLEKHYQELSNIIMNMARVKREWEPVQISLRHFLLRVSEIAELESAIALFDKATIQSPPRAGLFVAQARVLERARRLDEALIAARKAADLAPQLSFVHQTLAYLLLKKGMNSSAIEEALEAVRLSPTLCSTWNTLAIAYDRSDQPELAYGAALAGLRQDKRDWPLLCTITRLHERRGSFNKAFAAIDYALKLTPLNHTIYDTKAHIYMHLKDWDGTVRVWDDAISKGLENPEVFVAKGIAYTRASRYDEAFEVLSKVPSEERSGLFWNALGHLYSQMDKHEEAIEAILKVPVEERPTPSWNILGYCYSNIGQDEEAINAFLEVPQEELPVQSWEVLAHCFSRMGKHKKAIKAFLKVPQEQLSTWSWNVLAHCYSKSGMHKNAIEAFLRVPKEELSPKTWIVLGHAYFSCNQFYEAVQSFKEAQKSGVITHPWDQAVYGMSLAEIKEETGLEWLHKALDGFQDGQKQGPILIMLGSATRQLRGYVEATPILEQAVKSVPTAPHAHYALARAYEDAGRFNVAISELQLALDLNPRYSKAQAKLGELQLKLKAG